MNATRPTSILRVRPSRRTTAALREWVGRPNVFLKSPPVPLGKMPSSTSFPEARMPLATSEIVPSRPHVTISFTPLRAASVANDVPWPGFSVKATLKAPKLVTRSDAIFGQALRVAPPADSGFTMTRGRGMALNCFWSLVFVLCAPPGQTRDAELEQSTKLKAQSSKYQVQS